MNELEEEVYYTLKALCRLLNIGIGLSLANVTKIYYRAAIDVMLYEKTMNMSEISGATGLSRKNIRKLIEDTEMKLNTDESPAAKVLSNWCSLPHYQSKHGEPKVLSIEEFKDLCEGLIGDLHPGAVLKVLIDWEVVKEKDRKLYITRKSLTNQKIIEKTGFMALAAGNHLNTIFVNKHIDDEKNLLFDRVVYSDQGIATELITDFRTEIKKTCINTYDEFAETIGRYESKTKKEYTDSKKINPGVGIYQIMQTLSPANAMFDTGEFSPIQLLEKELYNETMEDSDSNNDVVDGIYAKWKFEGEWNKDD